MDKIREKAHQVRITGFYDAQGKDFAVIIKIAVILYHVEAEFLYRKGSVSQLPDKRMRQIGFPYGGNFLI